MRIGLGSLGRVRSLSQICPVDEFVQRERCVVSAIIWVRIDMGYLVPRFGESAV